MSLNHTQGAGIDHAALQRRATWDLISYSSAAGREDVGRIKGRSSLSGFGAGEACRFAVVGALLVVLAGYRIEVTPDVFILSAGDGRDVTETLTLQNPGDASVDYTLTTRR